MDQVHVIRHKHFNEGHGIRRIAREMGLHRLTVRKYLESAEPLRRESAARRKRVLDEVGPRIDVLLNEWRSRTSGKHRITSPRVHRQLIEEGYHICERTVRQYLAERRRQSAEVYIPLVHRAGDEAQVDFFEVTVDLLRVPSFKLGPMFQATTTELEFPSTAAWARSVSSDLG